MDREGPCFHKFEASEYEDYEFCPRCLTYRSRLVVPPEEVYTGDYWTHETGHSTLDEQVGNIIEHLENGRTKWDFVRQQINVENKRAALDIGCAPGVVLGRLQKQVGFQWVCGIDAIHSIKDDIYRIADAPCVTTVFGIFPTCTESYGANRFDLIVALDVFEHSHRPWPFLSECQRVLVPGGQLLMMMPLNTGEYKVPPQMFSPKEHVWIHSMDNMARLMWSVGFYDLKFDAWCAGHETVSATRGERPQGELRR